MNPATFFLDILFPPLCLNCDAFGHYLCQACQKELVVSTDSVCPHCLDPIVDRTHLHCQGDLEGITACWLYNSVVQHVIKGIKYRYYSASIPAIVEKYLATCSQEKYPEFYTFLQLKPIVIPVPLHPKRQQIRGFNQASLFGKYFANYWKLPFSDKLIQRTQYTQPQAELPADKRSSNVQQAFRSTGEASRLGKTPLHNQAILLVDDVVTTGATLKACATVLKDLGAAHIWGLALAR